MQFRLEEGAVIEIAAPGEDSESSREPFLTGEDTFTGEEYALMTLTSEGLEFEVVSDEQGKVWFIAGTDSGFESQTKVYYDQIWITVVEE